MMIENQDSALSINNDGQREDERNPIILKKRRMLVSVYVCALALLHADYNLLAPNLTLVAEEFGMDDNERDTKLGGDIALSFFLCGAPAALLVGWLSDRYNHRAAIFAAIIFIGELSCFATYFVKDYAGLLVTRSITGISIGGSLPVVFSVLGDVYQAEGRNASSGLVATAVGLGLGIGQGIAGYVGPTYGWRVPFLIVSIPSFFVGFLSYFLPDPERGSQEKAVLEQVRRVDDEDQILIPPDKEEGASLEYEEKREVDAIAYDAEFSHNSNFENLHTQNQRMQKSSTGGQGSDHCEEEPYQYDIEKPDLKTTLAMVRTPTMILLLIQGAPNVIPFGITSVFLNDYLAQDKGLTTEEATSVLIMFGAGNAIGVILGSVMGHYFYKKDVRIPALLMGSSIILTTIPMYAMINMKYDRDGGSIATASALTFLAGLLSIFPIPIERAILTNVTLPETRGRANSFLSIIDDLGKGLGPFLLSRIISSLGRKTAFNLSLIGWLVGGSISLGMICTVKKDEANIQTKIRDKISRRQAELNVVDVEEASDP